jgi:hypothetical protein
MKRQETTMGIWEKPVGGIDGRGRAALAVGDGHYNRWDDGAAG